MANDTDNPTNSIGMDSKVCAYRNGCVCVCLFLRLVSRDPVRNGFQYPVLKHGPRSLTYMRVFGCLKPWCVMKERYSQSAEVGTPQGGHYRPIFSEDLSKRPERW